MFCQFIIFLNFVLTKEYTKANPTSEYNLSVTIIPPKPLVNESLCLELHIKAPKDDKLISLDFNGIEKNRKVVKIYSYINSSGRIEDAVLTINPAFKNITYVNKKNFNQPCFTNKSATMLYLFARLEWVALFKRNIKSLKFTILTEPTVRTSKVSSKGTIKGTTKNITGSKKETTKMSANGTRRTTMTTAKGTRRTPKTTAKATTTEKIRIHVPRPTIGRIRTYPADRVINTLYPPERVDGTGETGVGGTDETEADDEEEGQEQEEAEEEEEGQEQEGTDEGEEEEEVATTVRTLQTTMKGTPEVYDYVQDNLTCLREKFYDLLTRVKEKEDLKASSYLDFFWKLLTGIWS